VLARHGFGERYSAEHPDQARRERHLTGAMDGGCLRVRAASRQHEEQSGSAHLSTMTQKIGHAMAVEL
jgi:hypothetical protein